MAILLDIVYLFGLLLALPLLVYKSWRTGKYRTDWAARLGWVPAETRAALQASDGAGRVMLHCVSVGEVLSTRLLVEQLLQSSPDIKIIITTTTDTGTARVRAMYAGPAYARRVYTLRYPLDLSLAVGRFLDAVNPALVVLVELETWPNFIRTATARHIPVRIVNGRLTQRSLRRYRWIRPLMVNMLAMIESFGVQTPAIARRFESLGASPERIQVLPTMKYDTAEITDQVAGAEALGQALGIRPGCQLLVGGSTGPGEEDALISVYLELREAFPALRLALAPRKPETLRQVLTALRGAGLVPVLRSTRPDGTVGEELAAHEVAILDTLGELKKLYSLALGVFSGRSLIPLGGSDMIEVAALAKPCCFGPHTYNFADAVELLLSGNAAVVVHNAAELKIQVKAWLGDAVAARAMGLRGRACIEVQRGSSARYAREILARLHAASRPC